MRSSQSSTSLSQHGRCGPRSDSGDDYDAENQVRWTSAGRMPTRPGKPMRASPIQLSCCRYGGAELPSVGRPAGRESRLLGAGPKLALELGQPVVDGALGAELIQRAVNVVLRGRTWVRSSNGPVALVVTATERTPTAVFPRSSVLLRLPCGREGGLDLGPAPPSHGSEGTVHSTMSDRDPGVTEAPSGPSELPCGRRASGRAPGGHRRWVDQAPRRSCRGRPDRGRAAGWGGEWVRRTERRGPHNHDRDAAA